MSVETVYKQFRNKGGLLKAVYDVRMAGDDEPVPIAERPEYLAIGGGGRSPTRRSGATPRSAGSCPSARDRVTARVLESRGAHPEVEEFARTIEGERLHGATAFVAPPRPRPARLRAGPRRRPGARPPLGADLARDLGPAGPAPRAGRTTSTSTWLSEVVADALLERS